MIREHPSDPVERARTEARDRRLAAARAGQLVWMDAEEAAAYLNYPKATLDGLAEHGEIPRHKRDDADYRYNLPELDEWLVKRLEAEAAEALKDVYFIQPIGGGPIKIGIARNVEKRLAALNAASPYPLRVLYVLRGGGLEAERELHAALWAHRSHGEWFYEAPEVLAKLEETKRLTGEEGGTP